MCGVGVGVGVGVGGVEADVGPAITLMGRVSTHCYNQRSCLHSLITDYRSRDHDVIRTANAEIDSRKYSDTVFFTA